MDVQYQLKISNSINNITAREKHDGFTKCSKNKNR